MAADEMSDPERRRRSMMRSSAQQREDLLKELRATQQQEWQRNREADAEKTARLRALRLAKEAEDVAKARLKGASGQS